MTVGKASAFAAGFVGAIALGIAIGPTVQDRFADRPTQDSVVTEHAAADAPTAASAPAPTRRARPARAASAAPSAPAGSVVTVPVGMWEPEFRDRAKAVLNPGARLELAAEDFSSAEEFMTVAHAARNTGVPFMVLKHRVLNERQTLADAIGESKPDADAKAEVARAREAARADLVG
jgi:hypothetical protein